MKGGARSQHEGEVYLGALYEHKGDYAHHLQRGISEHVTVMRNRYGKFTLVNGCKCDVPLSSH